MQWCDQHNTYHPGYCGGEQTRKNQSSAPTEQPHRPGMEVSRASGAAQGGLAEQGGTSAPAGTLGADRMLQGLQTPAQVAPAQVRPAAEVLRDLQKKPLSGADKMLEGLEQPNKIRFF